MAADGKILPGLFWEQLFLTAPERKGGVQARGKRGHFGKGFEQGLLEKEQWP